jgi:hypothetical protein
MPWVIRETENSEHGLVDVARRAFQLSRKPGYRERIATSASEHFTFEADAAKLEQRIHGILERNLA